MASVYEKDASSQLTEIREDIRMAQRRKSSDKGVDWSTLKGKFFHDFDDEGFVRHQGYVVDLVGDEIAIVQYFEWAIGSPSTVKAVWVRDIVDGGWALYDSSEAMREASDYGFVRSRPETRTETTKPA